MPTSTPIFGKIDQSVQYVERPGAYGFLHDQRGRLAIVRTTFGFFLPGGGVDPGESTEEALRREIYEEIGYRLLSAHLACEAVQYHWSEYYKTHFKKIGHFYKIEAEPLSPHPGYQDEHDLLWWTVDEARLKLSQEFQRWATTQI